jgi:hypothetical protein
VSICRVRVEAESRYGLQRCIVTSGSGGDTIDFAGEKQRDETFTLDAQPGDSLMRIRVEDIYGNGVEHSRPIFIAQRKETAKRSEQRTIELVTRERSINNPITAAAYGISRFTGNPISWLAREVLTRQAEDQLAATADFNAPRPSNIITFPFGGTIHNGLFDRAVGAYTTRFFAEAISFNGTRITALANPTLRRVNGRQDCCAFNLKAPLFSGKYPSTWSVDTSGTLTHAVDGSSVLLCAAARCRERDVTLYDIPCRLPEPKRNAGFVLYHSTIEATADTLTVTWCIRYLDRTSEMIHRQFNVGSRGVNALPGDDKAVIHASPRAFVNRAGERCLIVEVRVEGSREIFRIDAFVHSLAKHQVVGWGAASCPG